MERTNVRSSNLKSIGYDEETETLEIEFKGGSVYQYTNVPKGIHASLMNASSHGKYVHRFIRERYPTKRLR